MKIFSIFFYLGCVLFIPMVYGYFQLGWFENMMEYYKNFWIKYWIYDENIDFFTLNFHFYLLVFFSIFFTFWWGLMSGKIKMVYMPAVMALIFAVVWYFIETVRFWFYLTSWIVFFTFIYTVISIPSMWNQIWFIKKLSQRRKNNFKNHALQAQWNFVQIITDYSIKINKRPAQRAVYQVLHPLTDKEFLAQSERSFDPLFPSKVPKVIEIYFDKNKPEKYLIDLQN